MNILKKVTKTIGLSRKLLHISKRPLLLIIFKSFIRPDLDYGDIIYNQTYNASFHHKLESTQFNSALTLIDPIRLAKEKFYHEYVQKLFSMVQDIVMF